MAHADMVLCIHEGLPLLWRQLIQMAVNVPDVVIFCDELAGSDLSHSLDSRHIVGCVTAYRQDLDHLFRPADSVFLADLRGVYDLILASGLARLVLQDPV